MSVPLHAEGTAVVAADGTASVTLAVPYPQRWSVTRLSTMGRGPLPGELRVWRGLTGTLVGTSSYAIADASQEEALALATGETVRAEWRACTPGTVMRFVLEGTIL